MVFHIKDKGSGPKIVRRLWRNKGKQASLPRDFSEPLLADGLGKPSGTWHAIVPKIRLQLGNTTLGNNGSGPVFQALNFL